METRSHAQIQKKLIFYLDNQLGAKEHQQVVQHLSGCDECAAFLRELQSTLCLLEENKQHEPGAYFYASIQNRLQAGHRQPLLGIRLLQPAILVLLLALGIRLGIWIGTQSYAESVLSEQAVLVPFNDLAEEPIEEFLLNLK
ncbi:anti-sigma factor [Mangrovibacterium marinum]|uniref:Putative zinc finger protein n=1 Tax=Mangrovibacterium marinum TaxID=1639118 RepID=A0A2T5BXR5_9BACT|nr:zf-HC2 domain-containing protein [Mangrovibacterium marinum]PTN05599.1 putative zinc finger protein [Mangrovibacterium marinum]